MSQPIPPGSGQNQETRIVVDAAKLAEIDSAPDAFAAIVGTVGPPQESEPDRESAAGDLGRPKRKAPEPDFMRLNTPSPKPRYDSDSEEDDSDLNDRLPLILHDDRKLRQRRQARTVRQEERRQNDEWWIRWEARARGVLKAWLPKSFTKEMSIEAGAGLGRWAGVDRLAVLWDTSRTAVKVTAVALLAFCVLWWFVLPLIFGGGGVRSLVPSHQGEGGPWGTRVDGAGAEMLRPLPLCDLLYDRGEHAARSDRLSAQLSQRAADRIREWWRTSGPPLGQELRKQHRQQQARGVETEAPRTRVHDHHLSSVWDHLTDSGAVRFSLDHERAAEQAQPAALGAEGGQSLEVSKKVFDRATREWLAKRCKAAAVGGKASKAPDEFAAAAAGSGALVVDVTGYVSGPAIKAPPTREPLDERKVRRERERHELEELLRIEDDGPGGTKASPVPPSPPMMLQKLLPPPPPAEVSRNVSIYDLHVLMGYLASQARDSSVTRGTATELEAQLGNRVAWAAVSFDPAAVAATGDKELLPQGKGPDPWSSLIRDQLSRLDHERDADLAALRGSVLWSGISGCTCAHHVGIPIPAASWYEPPQLPHMPEGRVRVLFYPLPDAVVAERASPFLDASMASLALRWLAGGEANSGGAKNRIDGRFATRRVLRTDIELSSRVVWWTATDPVLGAVGGGGDDPQEEELMQVPMAAMMTPWTWVEGIDFRGNKRRHRVSPRSLACVLSCTRACGGGGGEN